MSKTKRVTAATMVVMVNGNRLVRGTDGNVWLVGSGLTKGSLLGGRHNASIAVRKEGVAAVKALASANAKFEAAKKAYDAEKAKVKVGREGSYGPLQIGDSGAITVGCTRIEASEVPRFIKLLGL